MVKTTTLTGAETEITGLGGQNVAVKNLSGDTVYASPFPNVTAGADYVCEIPAGAGEVVLDAHGTVYLLGTGKVQCTGTPYAFVNFNSPSSGSSSGGGGGGGGGTTGALFGKAELITDTDIIGEYQERVFIPSEGIEIDTSKGTGFPQYAERIIDEILKFLPQGYWEKSAVYVADAEQTDENLLGYQMTAKNGAGFQIRLRSLGSAVIQQCFVGTNGKSSELSSVGITWASDVKTGVHLHIMHGNSGTFVLQYSTSANYGFANRQLMIFDADTDTPIMCVKGSSSSYYTVKASGEQGDYTRNYYIFGCENTYIERMVTNDIIGSENSGAYNVITLNADADFLNGYTKQYGFLMTLNGVTYYISYGYIGSDTGKYAPGALAVKIKKKGA